MATIKETNYLAITAMLAARTSGMLSLERMERMSAAPSDDEAVKVLEECGYGDLSGLSLNEINAALEKHIAAVFDEVENMAPEKALVQMFRLKYDFHNIKTIVKSHGADVDGSSLLSERGSVDVGQLQEAFRSGEYAMIPTPLAEAMQEASSTLSRTANPQLADFSLDRAYFVEMAKLADSVADSRFAKDYVRLLIDSANMRSAVRTWRMGKDADFLRLALIPGGEVSADNVALADSGDALADLYRATRVGSAVDAAASAVSGGSLTAFEKACDNAVMQFVREAKIMRFGAAHVVSYLAAMENETTAARMILAGRQAGLKPETLRERLRDTYA